MDDAPHELIEELLGEYDRVFRDALPPFTAECGTEEPLTGRDLAQNEQLARLFERLQKVQPDIYGFGRHVGVRAGMLAKQFVREVVLRTPTDLVHSLRLAWTLVGVIDGVEDDDPDTTAYTRAQIAREAVRALSDRGWSPEPVVDAWILRELANQGAAPEALELLRLLETQDTGLADKLANITGFIAHKAGKHILAIDRLEEVADRLVPEELRALADSLRFLRRHSEALPYYEDALREADGIDLRLACAYGAAECHEEASNWSSALKVLNDVAEEAEAAAKMDYDWFYVINPLLQNVLRVIGYVEVRRDWQGGGAVAVNAAVDDLEAEIQLLQQAPLNCEVWEPRQLSLLSKSSGAIRALKDIASDTRDERNKLEFEAESFRKQRDDGYQTMVPLLAEVQTYRDGSRQYVSRLIKRYPTMPKEAAHDLGWAEFLWRDMKTSCSPQSVIHSALLAVDRLLLVGLVKEAKAAGAAFQEQDAERYSCGTVAWALRKNKDSKSLNNTDLESFIRRRYHGALMTWLLEDASRDLGILGGRRNRSDHPNSVSESEVPHTLEIVFGRADDGGILKFLVELGDPNS